MSRISRALGPVGALLGVAGRFAGDPASSVVGWLRHVSGVWHLFILTLKFSFIVPLGGRSKLRKQLFPMMSNVGVRSLPIVALISALIGSILVLQTGEAIESLGQIQEVPGLVALSMTRELGPLMTAVIMTARVGASFTAVLASMKINDEIMALETMAINPVGYLVAPRFLSMLIMVPCLTVIAYLVGMIGGGIVAFAAYDITSAVYIMKSTFYLDMADVYSGLIKGLVFGVLITMVCCYYGLITEGGPMGLGRNTMVAVVTSLVVVIVADALLTAVMVSYVY